MEQKTVVASVMPRNPTLLALGILLTEITIGSLQNPNEAFGVGRRLLADYMTARRLLNEVYRPPRLPAPSSRSRAQKQNRVRLPRRQASMFTVTTAPTLETDTDSPSLDPLHPYLNASTPTAMPGTFERNEAHPRLSLGPHGPRSRSGRGVTDWEDVAAAHLAWRPHCLCCWQRRRQYSMPGALERNEPHHRISPGLLGPLFPFRPGSCRMGRKSRIPCYPRWGEFNSDRPIPRPCDGSESQPLVVTVIPEPVPNAAGLDGSPDHVKKVVARPVPGCAGATDLRAGRLTPLQRLETPSRG